MRDNDNEINEVYEASALAYAESIKYALDIFIQLLISRIKNGHADAQFLKEWAYPLTSPGAINLTAITEIETIICSGLSEGKGLSIDNNIINDIRSIFQDSQIISDIYLDTSKEVSLYVEKYDITTRGIDNYKVRYFMGLVITGHLENNFLLYQTHPRILRAISRLMMLRVMQDTLKIDTDTGVTPDMFKKFAVSLLESKARGIDDLFGDYGLYLIFKTVAKCHQAKIT